ncbi:hypothetical protein [Peribacillus simplex]|uniref:hypothetical protein n=1 Tax=Peribacillus simplex TaxID=1478 RepID=UPI003D2D3CC4
MKVIDNMKKDAVKGILSECRQTRFSSTLSTFFYGLYNLNLDWNVGHSLSAGGPPSAPAGSPLDAVFPQKSRTFRSGEASPDFCWIGCCIAGVTYTAVKEVSSKLKKKKHKHYMAMLTKGDLYIGNSLSKAQAVSRLKSSDKKITNNVCSVSYTDATTIAREAGNNKTPVVPERDKGRRLLSPLPPI